MDYRTAYEQLSSILWQYIQEHDEVYVRLMLAVRDIEDKLGNAPKPPRKLDEQNPPAP